MVVFDAEANGLLDTVTKVWCICTHDLVSGDKKDFKPNNIEEGLDYLFSYPVIIGHNIVEYDLEVFKKVYGKTYNGNVFDTLVASRVLWPDRPLPRNIIDGQRYDVKKYGRAHSIGAWGWRFNHLKPEHEDWSKFSDEMLHRCREDRDINVKMLNYLLNKEARLKLEEIV